METLANLESFVRSAETGSFSAAARRLALTPAAVSRNVALLERNLGVRLFQRSTRKLTLTEGTDKLMIFGGDKNHDAHCRVCGSLLYSLVRNGGYVHVPMGTLVDVPTIRPTAHIFVGSKASWFAITDDLPQYEAHQR